MADWKKVKVEEVRRGNVVEVENKMGQVLSVQRNVTLGPTFGHIELYLKEHGPITVPPNSPVDVFK